MSLSTILFDRKTAEQILQSFNENPKQTFGDKNSGEVEVYVEANFNSQDKKQVDVNQSDDSDQVLYEALLLDDFDLDKELNKELDNLADALNNALENYLMTCTKGSRFFGMFAHYHYYASDAWMCHFSPALFAELFELPENHPFLLYLEPFVKDSGKQASNQEVRTDGQAVTEALIKYLTSVEPMLSETYYSYNKGTVELEEGVIKFEIVKDVNKISFFIEAPIKEFETYFPKFWNSNVLKLFGTHGNPKFKEAAIVEKLIKLRDFDFSPEALAAKKAAELARNEPYGMELAQKVYRMLKKARFINGGGQHRDYCGVGFAIGEDRNKVVYGHFWDGYPYPDAIKVFEKPEDFIEWLAVQTDNTMDGRDEDDSFYHRNQRITKGLLQWFVGDVKL